MALSGRLSQVRHVTRKVPVGRQAKNESEYLVETRIDMYATFHVVCHGKLVVFHNETDQK